MYLDPKHVLRGPDLHVHEYVLDLESSEYDVIRKISCNYTRGIFFLSGLVYHEHDSMNDTSNLNTYIEQMKLYRLLDLCLQWHPLLSIQ